MSLEILDREVAGCRLCPRLVAWRERVAREKRRAFRDETYWGRPVPGFGDPDARILVVGLAPAAHGANRTGRMFTGDSSGDWLFATLHGVGLASRPTSTRPGDGLALAGCRITAAARCAPPGNRPTPEELRRCAPFLAREIDLLPRVRVVVALGAIAWEAVLRRAAEVDPAGVPRPRPRFGHAARTRVTLRSGEPVELLGSYHPSRQNTQTGRLTREMLRSVFVTARRLARGADRAPRRSR